MSRYKSIFNKLFNWGVVLAPIILLLLPIDLFDKGESLCLSKQLANMECYACGLTRGTMHFVHFDFKGAWTFNKLTFIVMPLLFLFWLKSFYIIRNKTVPAFLKKIM